jgi:3-oxoacyl-[acyl-carrier protein] reductase
MTMGVLEGRVALVTGSGRGIGRATAGLLVEHGASVVVNDLDADVASQAASELGDRAVALAGSVTEPGFPEALVAKAVEAFGRLDILVNNAGYTWDGVIHKMSDEQFQAMLDVHTVAPFRMIRAAAPHMRDVAKAELEAGQTPLFRKIVNVSSISGLMGNAGQANYASGKAGLIGLTKTMAREWGQFQINVNAVAFGFVETRMTAPRDQAEKFVHGDVEIQMGIPQQFRELAASTIPLGRAATPEEAAGGIFFLCSPWSNFVQGQVLNVTGGQIAGMGS